MIIDFTEPLGKVRLLITDIDEDNLVFGDHHIDAYLDLNDGNVHRAAADALDAMATTEVLLSKKIRTQDISTDGPAVAADLRKLAASLRAKADAADAVEEPFFEIVPFGYVSKPEGAEWRL